MKRKTVVILLIGLLLALTATPAQAHFTRLFEGLDYASVGGEHRWTEVCDMERDGHGVIGHFYDRNYRKIFELRDPNGSAGGCGNRTASVTIYSYAVCEDWPGTNDCSAWRGT
jgi:hypothetical protein